MLATEPTGVPASASFAIWPIAWKYVIWLPGSYRLLGCEASQLASRCRPNRPTYPALTVSPRLTSPSTVRFTTCAYGVFCSRLMFDVKLKLLSGGVYGSVSGALLEAVVGTALYPVNR